MPTFCLLTCHQLLNILIPEKFQCFWITSLTLAGGYSLDLSYLYETVSVLKAMHCDSMWKIQVQAGRRLHPHVRGNQ